MFAVHELGFLATRVDVAICANVMDFCVRRQPTTTGGSNIKWGWAAFHFAVMLRLPRIPIGHEQGNGGFAKHALMRRL